jgi:hypothetical protein
LLQQTVISVCDTVPVAVWFAVRAGQCASVEYLRDFALEFTGAQAEGTGIVPPAVPAQPSPEYQASLPQRGGPHVHSAWQSRSSSVSKIVI